MRDFFQCGSYRFPVNTRESQPLVMGILNVTPDSFFDGGKFYSFKNAMLNLLNAGTNDLLCKFEVVVVLWDLFCIFVKGIHRLTSFCFLFLIPFIFCNCYSCIKFQKTKTVDISNRMVQFHSMLYSLFATAGDDKMASAICFTAAGVSIRRVHAVVVLTICLAALVCATGASMKMEEKIPK